MSRIADALGRAGRALPAAEGVDSWEMVRHGAEALLKGPSSSPLPIADESVEVPERLRVTNLTAQAIHPPQERPVERISTIVAPRPLDGAGVPDYELVVVVRQLFLFSRRPSRSVLFCTPPGDPVTDVAWQAAEVLAAQSGRRVAFVAAEAEAPMPAPASRLITRVAQATAISGLGSSFDFVIVNEAGRAAEGLMQTARDVDGVVVLVTENATRRTAARGLVAALRRERINVLGVLLVRPESS